MSLLSLDQVVWRDILLNWLGSLREIVRLDFAVGASDIKNQFRDVFEQLVFPLPTTARISDVFLVGLLSWMKQRNLYLNRVEVRKFMFEWEEIFLWCGNSLKQLHIVGMRSGNERSVKDRYCKDTAEFMSIASTCCFCLQECTLKNGHNQSGGTMHRILRNNALTLNVLIVKGLYGEESSICLDGISCPNLRVLLWENEVCTSFGVFLRRCPNLFALSLKCNNPSESLISALTESCLLLTRLQWCGSGRFGNTELLRIVRGCGLLEYLEVFGYTESGLDASVDIAQALPHLHTLSLGDEIAESSLLTIAARGLAPALRVLDVDTVFTCTGFRQFTFAHPRLTGINVCFIDINVNVDNRALFEHCGELRHLVLSMSDAPKETVDTALRSVALCCPRLEVLELGYGTHCGSYSLQRVLNNCINLKIFINHQRFEDLVIPPGVVVAREGPPLPQWMPAAGEFQNYK